MSEYTVRAALCRIFGHQAEWWGFGVNRWLCSACGLTFAVRSAS